VSRTVPTEQLPEDAPLVAAGPGPEQSAERAEAVQLVWDAAASLEPRQFSVLDLALRKGLSSAEIGTVLGLDAAQSSLALHRARESLGHAVRYLVIARRRRHCQRLAELVPAGVRSLSAEQRVDHHLRRCPTCQRTALVLTAPGELFAAIPLAALPWGLLQWRGAPAQALASSTSPLPHRHQPAPRAASRHLAASAAGIAAVVAVLALVIALSRHSAQRHIAKPLAATPGCADFDVRPGDQCANIGGTLGDGRWTITVAALVPSFADTGRPQLCSQVTAINRGREVNLMTGLFWSLETAPPGSATHIYTVAPTISGTINKSGYIQPGGTARGTVCFADVGHPGQVLVVYKAFAGSTRGVWITKR